MKDQQYLVLKRIFSFLKDRKKTLFFLGVLITFAQLASVAGPFIYKILIDSLTQFISNPDTALIPWKILIYCSLGILAVTVLGHMIRANYDFRLFKLATTTEDKLRSKALEKYLKLHSLFHHGASGGQVIGRIDRGGTSFYSIINEIIGHQFVPSIIIFIGSFSLLLYQNIWIALAMLVPLPIYLFTTRKIANQIFEIEQEVNDAFEHVNKEMYDVAGNVLTVKKFSQEKMETDTHRRLMASGRAIQYEAENLWQKIENIQAIISTTGRIVVLLLSAWFVFQGTATIGEFILYVTLQNMAYQPLSSLGSLFTRLRRNLTRVGRVFTVLDEPLHVVDAPNAFTLAPLEREIEFKNVSFSYRNDGQYALKNINIVIPAGSTYALVGRSGGGKTTFINLLLRSYDPEVGQILIDSKDIKEATQASLREQIAIVPQEVDLFSRTVGKNIAYGSADTTLAQIESAAKTALAHDFIMKLERKYDTVVGERGIKLSGGERQRVGIARAVLRDPKILILDEATSHLDTESEKMITEATNALVKNRTSLIIAHRLSTVIHADKIIVFNQGQIEAVGNHTELLKTSETYKRLHSLQFAE